MPPHSRSMMNGVISRRDPCQDTHARVHRCERCNVLRRRLKQRGLLKALEWGNPDGARR